MEELENTNPTMENSGESPVNSNGLETENLVQEQQNADFSQLFSENIAEETPIEEDIAQKESLQQEEIVSPIQQELHESQPKSSNAETTTQLSETINTEAGVKIPTFTDNENDIQIPEHTFDKEIEHTSLDNHQNIQATQLNTDQRKAAIEQQKLAWLKQHESEAKKTGFTSGILSGILLMLLAFAACSVFAKNQVLNAIDYLGTLIPLNSSTTSNIQNTINLPNTEEVEIAEEENTEEVEIAEEENIEEVEIAEEENIEEIDEIQTYYNRVDEVVSSENDVDSKAEQLREILEEVMKQSEQSDTELTQYISQTIMDLTINTEEQQDEQTNISEFEETSGEETNNLEANDKIAQENNENVSQEIPGNIDNEISSDAEFTEQAKEQNKKSYTITHVNSEEEANWVLPAHCDDLTCYGEDQEFVECTSFRMIETLDENTSRVSSRGGCKYKDASELVYVQFN